MGLSDMKMWDSPEESLSDFNFGSSESTRESSPSFSRDISISSNEPTTEETVSKIREGVEGLGKVGSDAVKSLRSLFEQVKDKIKRKDVDRLESQIQNLEEQKKMELEKMGLTEQKKKLERELAEIKSRKLETII